MNEKHGYGHKDRIYRVWVAMRQRCNDPNRDGYHSYGGRGIRVCAEWDSSFVAFRDWAMQNGYGPELTIDREDNDGPYSPDNCHWISAKQQLSNTHRSRLVCVDGVTRNVLEWSKATGIVFSTLYKRHRAGVTGRDFIAPPKTPRESAMSQKKKAPQIAASL